MGHHNDTPYLLRRGLARWVGAALFIAGLAAAGPARAGHDFSEIDYLADELETVSRNVWIHSSQHQHHHDYAEQEAIRNLEYLSWAAAKFHETVDRRYDNVYAVDNSFDGLAQAFYDASGSYGALCVGYVEREEFGYAQHVMNTLFGYFGQPPRRRFNAVVEYHGGFEYRGGYSGHGHVRDQRRRTRPVPYPRVQHRPPAPRRPVQARPAPRPTPQRHAQPRSAPQRRPAQQGREGYDDGRRAPRTRPQARPQNRPQNRPQARDDRNDKGWRQGRGNPNQRPQAQAPRNNPNRRPQAQPRNDPKQGQAKGKEGQGRGKGNSNGKGKGKAQRRGHD